MMLTTHLNIVPKLIMCRAILPLTHMPSWLCTGTILLWDLNEDFIIKKNRIFTK